MRRVPADAGQWEATRRLLTGPRTVRSFLTYAVACVGTFAMAGRAVHWLGGPVWLVLVFLGLGVLLAGYYLVRVLRRRSRPGGSRG
ncbi:hypothetical protein ACU18_16320 [Arthrobacter sp. ZBG10]|uniref:hypothetical protein n=1 Tax=Micrococcaceae TaxID=1268 RepID=UPI00067FF0D5|nr:MULTISPECIES: hypothetical protein [Micrococcaceae]KNH15632.1 hypothetical protein ACU18_16320 [Arthrobacter sp. ZBG10]KQR03470.1 hypothetical protein ASF72_10035 [Arthrobacter sp. Leaf141]